MSAETETIKLPFWPRVIGCGLGTYILCIIINTAYPPDQAFHAISTLIVLCCLLLWGLSRFRVEISGNTLRYYGLGYWQINRREVASHYIYEAGKGLYTLPFLVLVPKSPTQRKQRLGFWFYEKPAFRDWMHDLPETRHEAAIPTPTEHPAAEPDTPAPARYRHSTQTNSPHIPVKIVRKRLRWTIFSFYAIYGVMFLGDLAFSHPPEWWPSLFFVPPFCALQLERMYPEYIRLAAASLPQDKRASRYKRVSVANVFFLPCILLPLWQLEEMHFRDIRQFAIITAVLTALFTAYVLHRAPDLRVRLKHSAGVLIFALGAAMALTHTMDTTDQFRFTQSTTKVTELYESHSRSGTHDYAVVQPIADTDAPKKFNISSEFYKRLHTGSKVCIRLHPGTIGIRWYSLGYCCK